MKIIQFQESYSSKNLRKLTPIAIAWLGILLFLAILLILTPFVGFLREYWFIILAITFLLSYFSKDHIDTLVDNIKSFRFGKEGEDRVIEELKKTLDDSYIYVTNYQIPNTRIGDIDGLLIGPKGIIIIEVKNFSGVFRFAGEDMYKRVRGDIYRYFRKNPIWQINRQREYLGKFLKEKGIDIKPSAIVVMAGGKISHISGAMGVFITEDYKLANHIFELNSMYSYSPELAQKILNVLGVPNN